MNRKQSYLVAALILLAGCQGLDQSVEDHHVTQFALMGDNPYQDFNYPKYQRMIEDVNSTPGIEWVIHLGDTKDGGRPCTDKLFRDTKALNDKFTMPFMLTPGDNDWFDCIRKSAGGYDRLERLARFREIFYSTPPGLAVISQPSTGKYQEYVENVYWIENNIMYGLVHILGVNGQEGGMDLHDDVMTAGVAWIDEIFSAAAKEDVAAVFIGTQTDPYPFSGERGWMQSLCPGGCPDVRPGYEKLHESLLRHARTWRKPILFANGDTHIYRVDKPLYDNDVLVEHFTRVEPYGELQVHWLRIVADPETRSVFSIHEQLVPGNTGVGWSKEDLHLKTTSD